MKVCINCGATKPDDAIFCGNCGTKFPEAQSNDTIRTSSASSMKNVCVLPIEDVFEITGRGVVVVGRIVCGIISTGDIVDIVYANGKTIQTEIIGIEMFKKILTKAQAGDNVGLFLKNVTKADVANAHAIVTRGANLFHKSFTANITITDKLNSLVFNNCCLAFVLLSPKSKIVSKGMMIFVDTNIECVKPGANVDVKVTLDEPCIMVEGGAVGMYGNEFMGNGKVTSIIETSENTHNQIPTPKFSPQPEKQINSQAQYQIQPLNEFFNNLLKEKGLTNLEHSVKQSMIAEMTTLLMDQINKAAIMKLSEEQADKLARLIDDPNFTNEKMTEFIVNSGVNLTEVTLDTMLKFRELYLGK